MVNFQAKKKFIEEKILIEGFILLDYTTTNNSLNLNLIGTDEQRKKLIIYEYKDKFNYEKSKFSYENNLPIHNIISCDFFSRNSIDYLLISKSKDKYFNKLVYDDNGTIKTKDLEETTTSPMLICHKNSRPSLLMQNNDKTQIVTFPKGKISQKLQSVEVKLPKLHPNHTSAYISLDNSYTPLLALDTFENNKRTLQIFKYENNNYIKMNQIDLPNEIGPLIFADFDNDTVADLAFISKENNEYFINLYFNKEIFGEKTTKKKIKLKYECILEENGSPTGLYPVDLFSNSMIHLALKIKKDNEQKYVLINNGTWDINNEVFDFKYSKIHSISFADLNELGRESLVLNYKSAKGTVLSFLTNDLLKEDCYSVSLLSYDGYAPEKSYCSTVTGMTYRYTFLENTKKGVGFQRPQTAYLTLKPPILFLGIGTSPFLINLEGIGGPFINDSRPYKIENEILPNSKLVIWPRDGKYYKIVLVLSTKQNVFYVFLIYFTVFVATVIVISYLHIEETKKRKQARKDEAVFFNFDAL